jgi:hypothetical protein
MRFIVEFDGISWNLMGFCCIYGTVEDFALVQAVSRESMDWVE